MNKHSEVRVELLSACWLPCALSIILSVKNGLNNSKGLYILTLELAASVGGWDSLIINRGSNSERLGFGGLFSPFYLGEGYIRSSEQDLH